MPAAKPSPKSGKIAPLQRRDKSVDPDPPLAQTVEIDADLAMMIERAAGYGFTPSEIGYLIGIPTKEVMAYETALASGVAKANFKVANAMFATACDPSHRGHVTAAIFWLKARAGWMEASAQPGDETPAAHATGERRELPDEEVRERFEATLSALRPKSTKG